MDAIFIDLREYRILPYGQEGSEGVEDMEAQIGAAEAILVGYPLYNFNMSAAFKALIERCGSCFEDKVVGLMVAAGGRSAYMSVMSVAQTLMLDCRAWIVPRHVHAVRGDFAAGSITTAELRQRVEDLVEIACRTAWQHRRSVPGV